MGLEVGVSVDMTLVEQGPGVSGSLKTVLHHTESWSKACGECCSLGSKSQSFIYARYSWECLLCVVLIDK